MGLRRANPLRLGEIPKNTPWCSVGYEGKSHGDCYRDYMRTPINGWSFFWRPFFFVFGARFFFCGWLVSGRTVPLLQAVAGKSWNFCRVQGFATQHSFWGLGFCNPTLLLGLKVLQPNIPFRASGFCNSTFLLGLRVLQPHTPLRA